MKNQKIQHNQNSFKIVQKNRKKGHKSIPLTHNYMTTHLPDLVPAIQKKVAVYNIFVEDKPPLLVK